MWRRAHCEFLAAKEVAEQAAGPVSIFFATHEPRDPHTHDTAVWS